MPTQETIDALKTRITKIETAIDNALTSGTQSQSISGGGASRSFTRYSLDELYTLERQLKARLNRMENGWAKCASFTKPTSAESLF